MKPNITTSILTALALTLALSVLSAPASSSPNLHPRGLPGAYYTCVSEHFNGPNGCSWSAPSPRCRMQGGQGMGIKSLGPDPGTLCVLFSDAECKGLPVKFVRYPGIGAGMPEFQAFRCYSEEKKGSFQTMAKGKGVVAEAEEGEEVELNPQGDARLAGGVGSADRKVHADVLEGMEKDGFKEGLVGLEAGMYY